MTSLQMTAPSGGSSSTHVSGTMVFALTALGVTAAVYALCNNNNSHRRRGVDGGLSSTLSNPKGSRYAATADGSEEAAQRARTPDGHVPPTPPIKNYFSTRAEAHVKRHSANQVEWYDAALGLNIPFSPILFSVKSEERQAPLVLLTLRYLRQEGHRIAITIEEMSAVMSAEEYKQANMHRIASCSEVLTGSSPSVRIGNSIYPQAEYCYVDETDQLRYVLSVFLTHDRLALSVQYVAPTRVHNIIPTAFYELIRSISFSPPSPTPSYLLVSEPRLGLGFRLSLNFSVYDGLVDGLDAIPDPTLQTDKSSITEVGSSPFATAVRRSPNPLLILAGYGPALPPVRRPRHQLSGSSSDLAPTSPDGSRWIQYLEPQVKASLGHFKLRGPQQPLRFVFREESQADRKPNEPQSGALVIRPLSHRASTRGNFVGLEDDDDDSTSTSAIDLHGAFVLMEVHAEAGSSCLPYLLGDEVYAMDHPSVGGTDAFLSGTSAYVAIFCFPMGDACVLFHFIASTAHLRFADFVAACTSTVQTISLGNHFGQGTSVIYSNTRHEVLPFMCPLPLSGEAENEVRVEEPQLGDPLAVIHIRGVESMTVLVRVFPLPQLEARRTSKSMAKTSTAAVAKMLERVIHGYLANLSEEVSVQQWERFTLNGRPALKLCFELANRGENGVAMDLTSSFGSLSAPGDRAGSVDGAWIDKESVLEDEVGTMNPFARYYPPPPPPASYAGAVGGSTASAGPQSPAGIGRPLIPAGNAASHAPSAGLHNSNLIDGRSPSPSEPRPDDGSEEERLPLRVAVVSCYEHHAFLLMTSASAYTLAVAQHEVVEAASRLSLLYTAMP